MATEPARSKALGSEDSVRGKHSPRDKKSARLKVTEHADGADAGGKDFPIAVGKDLPGQELGKRTVFVSQTEETSESLRCPESA